MIWCMTLHVPLFFQLFQSEIAVTKCKNVCLHGKNTSKNLGDFFDALDWFACPQKSCHALLCKPKPCVTKKKKSNLFFLAKKNKNCKFIVLFIDNFNYWTYDFFSISLLIYRSAFLASILLLDVAYYCLKGQLSLLILRLLLE